MKGSGLRLLRKEAKRELAPNEFADALEISDGTLTSWERQDELPATLSATAWQKLARLLLAPRMKRLTLEAFKVVPSEWTSIWVAHGDQIVLFPEGSRYFCLNGTKCEWLAHARRGDRDAKHDFGFCPRGEEALLKLRSEKTLLTWPLEKRKSLSLDWAEIPNHEWKRMPSRQNHFMAGGICYSLLHVPSARDGKARLLLSFENKLPLKKEILAAKPGSKSYREDKALLAKLRQQPAPGEEATWSWPTFDKTDAKMAKALLESKEFTELDELVRAFE